MLQSCKDTNFRLPCSSGGRVRRRGKCRCSARLIGLLVLWTCDRSPTNFRPFTSEYLPLGFFRLICCVGGAMLPVSNPPEGSAIPRRRLRTSEGRLVRREASRKKSTKFRGRGPVSRGEKKSKNGQVVEGEGAPILGPKNRPLCPKTAHSGQKPSALPKNRPLCPKTVRSAQKPSALPKNRPLCPKTVHSAQKPPKMT